MANEYFGKVKKSGIQIIPDVISTVALGAIVTLVSTILSSGVQGITRNFLVKKIHVSLAFQGATNGENFMIGIAANDSGISGGFASTALAALVNPEATEAYLTESELVKTVWHETVRVVHTANDGTIATIDEWFSVGGGKGIPCTAGAGPELFAFNPMSGSLTTGTTVDGVVTYYGVWLED